MEDNDHAGGEEVVIIVPVFTSADNIHSYKTLSVLEVNVDVEYMRVVCVTDYWLGFAREHTAYLFVVDCYILACTFIQWKQFVRQETATLHTVSATQGGRAIPSHTSSFSF